MKKNVKNYLILMIIFIIVIVGVILLVLIIHKDDEITPLVPSDNKCLNKGEVCSIDEIKSGLVVPVQVNEKKVYNFYVISNTKDTLTLMMSSNIGEFTDWNYEGINFKGPVTPLYIMYDYTKDWTYVPVIENYEYEDFGKKYCLEDDDKDETISCDGMGYTKVVIDGEKSYVDVNFKNMDTEDGKDYPMYNTKFRARLITLEELENLNGSKWLSNELRDNHGYWTLTSSTAANVGYMGGAYAFIKTESGEAIESVNVQLSAGSYNIGVRPVIVIDKKA